MPVDVANSPRDGSKSVVAFVRKAIKLWRKSGSGRIFQNESTNALFVAGLVALEALIVAFEALDDYPYEIDVNDPA